MHRLILTLKIIKINWNSFLYQFSIDARTFRQFDTYITYRNLRPHPPKTIFHKPVVRYDDEVLEFARNVWTPAAGFGRPVCLSAIEPTLDGLICCVGFIHYCIRGSGPHYAVEGRQPRWLLLANCVKNTRDFALCIADRFNSRIWVKLPIHDVYNGIELSKGHLIEFSFIFHKIWLKCAYNAIGKQNQSRITHLFTIRIHRAFFTTEFAQIDHRVRRENFLHCIHEIICWFFSTSMIFSDRSSGRLRKRLDKWPIEKCRAPHETLTALAGEWDDLLS